MVHCSWKSVIQEAYNTLDSEYRLFLERNEGYFPDRENFLNAFISLPRSQVRYILFGQDPYPRRESAGGYAFIDEKVKRIFSDNGLSKEVNRATSLRNFIKMALIASGDLSPEDTSQAAIASVDKRNKIETIRQLRENFEKNGVLLLNTALIFTDKQSSPKHIRAWRPFMVSLLHAMQAQKPTLILFGTHAKALKKALPIETFPTIEMEHPYNHTFINNADAQALFGPMALLER